MPRLSNLRQWLAAAALTTLALTSCRGLHDISGRTQSAPVSHTSTRVSRAVKTSTDAHPGKSGFHLLVNGHDAFAARLLLADSAEKTLDVQYFIWKNDFTGRILTERLLRAADRGVHVRVLLDDVGSMAPDDKLAALDSHPNIEIRLFNPARLRTPKLAGIAWEPMRLNRRMHNKSLTADGAVSIIGGRNIADEYFSANEKMNFADLDVAIIGPAVKEVTSSFELYWNSRAAIEMDSVYKTRHAERDLAIVRDNLTKHDATLNGSEYSVSLRDCQLSGYLKNRSVPYQWGGARVIYDSPDKVLHADENTLLAKKLVDEANRTREELYLVSPYFVPGKSGVDLLTAVRKRGIKVKVITNSLASNDGLHVHGGYKKYRKPLLREGVEIYEMKPDSNSKDWSMAASSGASLHSKTFAFDRKTLFVGSYNLDPRSRNLNTEIGVLIDSRALATAMPSTIDSLLARKTYRVVLEGERLVWISQENGKEVRYYKEPATTWSRRAMANIFGLLPIEDQL